MWCNRSKLLSANWMNPVNTTEHVVVFWSLAHYLERECHASLPWRLLGEVASTLFELPASDWPDYWGCVPSLGGSLVSELWGSLRRGEMSGGLCQKEGGLLCERHLTGTIKANQSTCWGHSQDSYWVTLLAWIFFVETFFTQYQSGDKPHLFTVCVEATWTRKLKRCAFLIDIF